MSHDDTMGKLPTAIRSQGGPRSRGEIERARAALIESTNQEIDRLVAGFHELLPRDQADAMGGLYARYSSRFQDSILDQVRTLLEAALKRKIFIPREHICFDLATPGYKDQRPGLNRLRVLLASGAINVFLVLSTNRLFRKTYKALQFVEEEVIGRGIRCVFVSSRIDSADGPRWEMMLQFHAVFDEFVVGMYSDHVRSAHEGLFRAGLVFGTLPFGYKAGQEVPGQLTKRGRPRCHLEIDPNVATWVMSAFNWFVDDFLTIDDIARRFNDDPQVPPSPRSLSGRWNHGSIRYLLTNARYRGWWQYGKTVNVWQGKKDYSRQIPRPEPLKASQWEHLRIVPDDLWFRAQNRLASQPNRAGRKPADGDRKSRPRLLNGLFYCPEHDRMLYVGGPYGTYMFCMDCRALVEEKRPLFSLLSRSVALAVTCQSIVALIRADERLVGEVIGACRAEAERAQRPDPARIEDVRRQVQRLDNQIGFILENAGETDADKQESSTQLRALRHSRAKLAAELAQREADRARVIVVPSEEEVRALLGELKGILERAAVGDAGDGAGEAREIIEILTGGRIVLEQVGERKAQRGWLRGRFRPNLVSFVATKAAGVTIDGSDAVTAEVVVNYREPTECEARADAAKALWDQGKLIKEIASTLRINRNLATKALAHWHESRGLEVPDGRSRRATLAKKQLVPPKYILYADEAKRLWDEGLLMEEIGQRLGLDSTTLTSTIAYWHTSRGLPVPDGRTRRKMLDRKCSRPYPDRRLSQRNNAPAA